jgi:hypothetical protein
MRVCWVTNEVYYSRLLRYLFNNVSSHVGVMFEFDDIALTTDINKPKGKVWDSRYWLDKYSIVWSMDVSLSHDHEIELYKICADYCVLRPYDMGAYYFGMIAGLKHKVFGIPYPTENTWANNTGGTCQDVVTPLVQNDLMRQIEPRLADIDYINFPCKTPDMVMNILKAATSKNPRIRWVFNGA